MQRHLVAAALVAGCVPRAHLTVLEAADLAVPADLRTFGVVDESGAEGQDASGAVAAVEGLVAFLQATSARDGLRGPCGEGIDAVVSLEGFSSSHRSDLQTRTDVDEDGEPIDVYAATLASQVQTSWRLEACDGRELDALADVVTMETWRTEADARAAAESDLPSLGSAVNELGFSAGVGYARRITSTIDDAHRPYFTTGDPRMRSAAFAVRSGDWQMAASIWRDVASSTTSDRVRARALHDLALSYEVLGHYRLALTYAEEAAATHDSARIRRYRDALRQLRSEHRVLRRGEAR